MRVGHRYGIQSERARVVSYLVIYPLLSIRTKERHLVKLLRGFERSSFEGMSSFEPLSPALLPVASAPVCKPQQQFCQRQKTFSSSLLRERRGWYLTTEVQTNHRYQEMRIFCQLARIRRTTLSNTNSSTTSASAAQHPFSQRTSGNWL